MVPVLFGLLPHLPRNVSAKVNRRALPFLDPHGFEGTDPVSAPPNNAIEEKLSLALQRTFEMTEPVHIHEDFFHGLGGDSLLAAEFISVMRTIQKLRRSLYAISMRPGLWLNWRNKQAHLTQQNNAGHFSEDEEPSSTSKPPTARPLAATIVQALFLLASTIERTADLRVYVLFVSVSDRKPRAPSIHCSDAGTLCRGVIRVHGFNSCFGRRNEEHFDWQLSPALRTRLGKFLRAELDRSALCSNYSMASD